jgi:hypothetical protein
VQESELDAGGAEEAFDAGRVQTTENVLDETHAVPAVSADATAWTRQRPSAVCNCRRHHLPLWDHHRQASAEVAALRPTVTAGAAAGRSAVKRRRGGLDRQGGGWPQLRPSRRGRSPTGRRRMRLRELSGAMRMAISIGMRVRTWRTTPRSSLSAHIKSRCRRFRAAQQSRLSVDRVQPSNDGCTIIDPSTYLTRRVAVARFDKSKGY